MTVEVEIVVVEPHPLLVFLVLVDSSSRVIHPTVAVVVAGG